MSQTKSDSAQSQMHGLINLQIELQQQLKRAHSNFKKTSKERLTNNYIRTKLELLENCWKTINENHKQILSYMDKKVFLETSYAKDQIYMDCEDEYVNTKIAMMDKLNELCAQPSLSSASTSQISPVGTRVISAEVKIPTMKLPFFNGQYTEWISFHDQFVSLIHNNHTLSSVQKLHYLKMHLVGEAASLLKNINISENNYEHAWRKLMKRYSNKRVIANSYLQKLMSLRCITTESANAIKLLLDNTTDCLSGLNSLGIDTSTWDAIIIYLTTSKLDQDSLKHWEEKINQHCSDSLPTLEQLTEFLEARFRSLEGIQSTRTNTLRTRPNIEKRVFHTASKECCSYCSGDHYIFKCKEFAQLTHRRKMRFIENKGLCFNCLIPYHSVKTCRQNTRCRKCNRRHHTLIHPENENDTSNITTQRDYKTSRDDTHNARETTSEEQSPTHDRISSHFTTKPFLSTDILLATALVKVRAKNGQVLQLRALIDQGSEGSFISEYAAQALGLRRDTVNSSISGLGDTTIMKSKHRVTFTLQSNCETSFNLCVNAYVLKTLTCLLPSRRVNVTWTHLQDLPLADPRYDTPGKIDILLGTAVYSRILLDGVITGPPGTPLAQKTQLGWILSGEVNTFNDNHNKIISMHITTEEENNLLQKFWEIESDETCKMKRKMTEEELQCEIIYKNTYKREKDGTYTVEIPLRDINYDYGDTKEIAIKRLRQLERRLEKDAKLKEEYTRVLMEYLELNHMKEIEKENKRDTTKCFYLPHHAVIKQDKSTSKLRIVFNASSKGPNGKSLNDNTLVGPTIQRDLRHIVMTWRSHEIALVADCVKMYRQIKVTEESANLQRIVWRVNGQLKEYKLLRVTFGTACAPYLATKTLEQLAKDEELNYPIASEITQRDFYMDDLLSGSDSVEDAYEIYRQMTELMKSGGFQLQKWTSNNEEFIDYIDKESSNTDDTYIIKTDEVVKTLGMRWDRKTDKFHYITESVSPQNTITKRSILADISRLYDPLGWLAPVIVVAKVLMQKLWLSGVTWDQDVPKEIEEEWIHYKNQLTYVKDISISRWLHTNKYDYRLELHGYSDASLKAYAAVVYLRVVKSDGNTHTQLVTAKTRVAPIKTISIPRLELCGAVLLARLLREVAETMKIKRENLHAYTDSNIVLAWLQKHPSTWKTFVANRTSEILTILPSEHWHHIASENNPADVASRGTLPIQLSTHELWWTGPKELKQRKIEYKYLNNNTTILEEKRIKVMTVNITEEFNLFTRYSSLTKLLRVTAYILRIFNKEKSTSMYLSGEEINKAMIKCIIMCQKQEYVEEIERLKSNKPVRKNSKIRTLNPLFDEKGILRVGGRIHNANIPDGTKHQVILPSNNPFTKLLILDSHYKTLHGGQMLMLSHLRRKYWITHAKSLVRQVIHKCVICVRYKAATTTQMMGSLPKVRVTPSKPFLHSGVDLAGPIDLRLAKGRGHKTQKGYIVIFICMVTRAIHIEIVSSLTAEDFIAAFKRFVARRGHCSHMWSDNATNLVAGNKELKILFDRSRDKVRTEIENLLANDGTTWHYIPASAPHFGGLWEAGVKSIKYHLRRTIGNTTLTYEEMTTVTSQIEACLNSRPISPISDDPSDLTPLTPGHFLLGEAPITVPEESYLDSNINRLTRWQLTQRMLQDFWTRWSTEYLTRLQQRPKWMNKQPNIQVGELILIKDDNLSPGKWSMARVLDTHPGEDNLTRVVTVKCRNSILKRPVTKICRLPVDND